MSSVRRSSSQAKNNLHSFLRTYHLSRVIFLYFTTLNPFIFCFFPLPSLRLCGKPLPICKTCPRENEDLWLLLPISLRNNDHLPALFFHYLRLWIPHKPFQSSITSFAGIGRTRHHRKLKGVVIDDIPARIGEFCTKTKCPQF